MQKQSGRQAPGNGDDKLIGRNIEIASLSDALAQARDGRPRFLFLSGPAGIGKSSLVRVLSNLSHDASCSVGIGRGHEGLRVPYLPLRDALQAVSMSDDGGGDALINLLNAGSATLAKQDADDPDQQDDKATWAGTLDAARGVEGLYRQAVELILNKLGQRPIVLAIEDLHWADSATLDLLSYLLAALNDLAVGRRVPLLVVLTHRPEIDNDVRRFISRASRHPMVERLEVAPLDVAQTRSLMEHLGIVRPAQTLVEAIYDATHGNPLFIETVLEDLSSSGAFETISGHTVAHATSEALRLSDDLEAAIAQNLDRLEDTVKTALSTAALLGTTFSASRLAAIVSKPEDQVADWLEAAESLVGEGEGGYFFRQPLVRQALTSRMRPRRRRQIHAQIATYLDSRNTTDPNESQNETNWECAYHIILAGEQADQSQALLVCRRAATQAAQVFAWGHAARAWIGAAMAAREPSDRADLHLEAALCYHNAWDWGPCVVQFERALDIYRQIGDPVGQARVIASRARSRLPSNVYGEAFDTEPLETAISNLGGREPGLRGLLHSRIADAHWNARAWEKCRESANTAMDLAREAGDERLASAASVPFALSEYQTVQLEKACETYRDGILHAKNSGQLWLENVPRQRLVHTLQLRNELTEAAKEHETGLAVAQQTGDVGEISFALANASLQAAVEGRLEEVEKLVHETLGAVERSRYPFGGLFAIMTLSYTRYLTGQWNGAKDALMQIETPGTVFEQPGPIIIGLARAIRDFVNGSAAAWTDTDDTVEKRRTRLLRQSNAIRELGQNVTSLGMGFMLLEHAVEAQVHEAAEILLPPLSQAYKSGLVLAPGWPLLAPRVIGLGRALLGQDAEAKRLLSEAIHVASRSGARLELARARMDLAHLLAADSGQAQRDEARRQLDAAYADFVDVGMAPLSRRAEALAKALGLRLEAKEVSVLADRSDLTLLRGIGAGRDASGLESDLLLTRESVAHQLSELGSRLDTDTTAETIAEVIDRRIVSAPEMPRVMATFLVTDMVDSTAILERLGDEKAQILMQAHNRLLRAAARDHNGREVSNTGDGFILAFRAAPQAVACAIAIQRALIEFNARPGQEAVALRMGLEAGEPLLDEERLFGRALVSAVRVCGQANGGQILISESVRDLSLETPEPLIDKGMHQLKGFRNPIRLFEVDWAYET